MFSPESIQKFVQQVLKRIPKWLPKQKWITFLVGVFLFPFIITLLPFILGLIALYFIYTRLINTKLAIGLCLVVALFTLLIGSAWAEGILNPSTSSSTAAKNSNSRPALTENTVAKVSSTVKVTPTSTVEKTPTPTPTPTPTKAPTPTPTAESPAQIENSYKATTADTSVTTLDKDGSNDQGLDVHFEAKISSFVKDSSGETVGANVSEPNSYSLTFVQVEFPSVTDITQVNQGDTIEVWGTDNGVYTGQNAFGGTVQEVVVAAEYMNDLTTGYIQ
jgi:membrane protein implicated in regulation of membrane protease activity